MDSHAVRVTNSLLAAIPSVLGFLPTESVILLATVPGPDGASALGPVVRADLGPMLAHPAAAADILGTRLADVPVLQLWIVVTTTSHTGIVPGSPPNIGNAGTSPSWLPVSWTDVSAPTATPASLPDPLAWRA